MRCAAPAPSSSISSSSSTTTSFRGRKILDDLGVALHALATWWDVLAVAKESGKFDRGMLGEVEKFMHDPPAGRRRMAASPKSRNSGAGGDADRILGM